MIYMKYIFNENIYLFCFLCIFINKMKENLKKKNICIIAHVDHGKTTLVDSVLKYINQGKLEQSMDKNDLERERGITILAKATCIEFKDENQIYKIHIVDTPGHVDFGSEVERIMPMVDAGVLLVDAQEGIMPQTKFVLRKAVESGKKIIIVINKIDKPNARILEVEEEILLFLNTLNYNEIPCFLYGSGREGFFSSNLEIATQIEKYPEKKNVVEFLRVICNQCPDVVLDIEKPFSFLVTLLDYDPFFKRIYIGKIYTGKIKEGDSVTVIDIKGNKISSFRILKLFKFEGANKITINSASAGDIIGISGGDEQITINHTICDSKFINPITNIIPIEPPTMSVEITCNNSPFVGKDATDKSKLAINNIKKRLYDEARINIGIRLEEKSESVTLFFRGELQLGVLLENMRREGFEITIKQTQILMTEDKKEPVELVIIETDLEYINSVLNEMNNRKAVVEDIVDYGNRSRLQFSCPTRFLKGFESLIKSSTCGNAVINRSFLRYEDYFGNFVPMLPYGVLVSSATGVVTQYALESLSISTFFVAPGDMVYEGQIIGFNSRPGDLTVNPTKMKALTNFRTQSSEGIKEKQKINSLSMEEILNYLNNITLVNKKENICLEITPKRLVLRVI